LERLADDNFERIIEVESVKTKNDVNWSRARKNLRGYQQENDLQQRVKR